VIINDLWIDASKFLLLAGVHQLGQFIEFNHDSLSWTEIKILSKARWQFKVETSSAHVPTSSMLVQRKI